MQQSGPEKLGILSGGLIGGGTIALLWPIACVLADPWGFLSLWLIFIALYELCKRTKQKGASNAGPRRR